MSENPIEVRELTYRYPRARRPAVDALSFSVASGEIVGLLGPNGAGKTTTIHAVLGLIEPMRGDVRLFGKNPLTHRTQALARVNFASVDVDLPSNLRVNEILSVFAGFYNVTDSRKVEELVAAFDLKKLYRQVAGSLSAGERMRLKLCKALLNEPRILVLDEPTLSLDPHMANELRARLRDMQRTRKLSILHTSHNMQEVETFCDRILFLHEGRTLAEGSPKQVLERFKSRSLDELFIRVATTGDLYEAR